MDDLLTLPVDTPYPYSTSRSSVILVAKILLARFKSLRAINRRTTSQLRSNIRSGGDIVILVVD